MTVEGIGDRELRGVVASSVEIAGDGHACPSRDDLLGSALEELDPRSNETVILHLGDCPSCAAQWRLAREGAGVIAGDDAEATDATGNPRSPGRRQYLVYLAAAASVAMVMLAGGLLLRGRGPEHDPSPPVYRAQPEDWLQSEVPEGVLLPRDACRLRWTAGPDGTLYDLTVTDGGLAPLLRVRGLESPEYLVAPETLADLAPGARILWRVRAQLPAGRQVMSPTFSTELE